MPNLIDPRYCCCVPLVNAGIYLIIAEQAAVAMAVGVLALATPAACPAFVTYIMAVICFIGVAAQPLGFFGVFREKTKTFRMYTLVNALLTYAALAVAAAIVIVSALRHNRAVDKCRVDYFEPEKAVDAAYSLSAESEALCMAFAWADVGFMGGIWVILFVSQSYFVYATRKYSVSQVSDHKLYHSVYSENPEAFTMSILQSRRYNPDSVFVPPRASHQRDEWDARPSFESLRHEPGPDSGGQYYGHQRGYSDGPDRGSDRYEDYGGSNAPQQAYPFSQSPAGYASSGK